MKREVCVDCDKPIANDRDGQEGEERLCWRDYNGGSCSGPHVDWRARALAAEKRVKELRAGRR